MSEPKPIENNEVETSHPAEVDKHHNQPLLDRVNTPADIKDFTDDQISQLSDEVRQATINAVSKTGGHLGAGLGVVELTTAIHAVFNTPEDKLIWDVGHQCYPHKILTGRKDRIDTIRTSGGLSGFTKRSESEYDPFGAGHSSTSISAGLGMAVASDLTNKDNHVIAVIGDGAMSAGMAFEALNNAGENKSKLIVILNDNEMSIAPPVGAMSRYLTRMVSSNAYINAREFGKKVTDKLPSPIRHAAKRAEEGLRVAAGGGSFFEEMGFYYIGPVDGHNMEQLLAVLRNARDRETDGPVLIHARTQKGKGYIPAERATDKMHGVKKFDVITGDQVKGPKGNPTYTATFAEQLILEADKDESIVAITAAMPDGTGLDKFAAAHPTKMFDVGIAEQHAVTFAAGLAAEGQKPFVAIYSTFLQRAYDQIVHDVAIQNLPVKFMIDRAGLVGADGATHAGSFDIAYLGCIPNMTLMAASSIEELKAMTTFAAQYNDGPIALRFPRGEGVSFNETTEPIQLGKGRIVHSTQCHPETPTPSPNPETPTPSCHPETLALKDLKTTKKDSSVQALQNDKEGVAIPAAKGSIAILSYGTRLEEALKATTELESQGKSVTVADARFAKPLDESLIETLVKTHDHLITIEEGSNGGFGAYVLEHLAKKDLLGQAKIKTLTLPDTFQDHDDPKKQYKEAGLVAEKIKKVLLK